MSELFEVHDNPRFTLITTTNGQTALAIPFPFQLATDIRILKTSTSGVTTELSRPANFSVSGAGNPAGGSATLVTPAKAGETYLVLGNTVPTRTTSIARAGKFNSRAADEDLDRLTLMVQELRRDVAQALRVAFGSSPGTVTIGAAGTLAVWGDAGVLEEGPAAAALEAIETALGVEAGRALLHGAGGSDPYEAGGRQIEGLADATEDDQAVTKQQLDAGLAALDPADLTARVDALELGWLTGDVKFTLDDAAQTGWLFAQGGFIGDASSNADVRANADTEALYAFIWSRRALYGTTIKTSAGAASSFGANAAADFAAHKQIELPDLGKRFPRAAGTGLAVGTKETNQNKSHSHTASSGSAGDHYHGLTKQFSHGTNGSVGNRGKWSDGDSPSSSTDITNNTNTTGAHQHSITVNADGGDEARPDSFVLRALIKL